MKQLGATAAETGSSNWPTSSFIHLVSITSRFLCRYPGLVSQTSPQSAHDSGFKLPGRRRAGPGVITPHKSLHPHPSRPDLVSHIGESSGGQTFLPTAPPVKTLHAKYHPTCYTCATPSPAFTPNKARARAQEPTSYNHGRVVIAIIGLPGKHG